MSELQAIREFIATVLKYGAVASLSGSILAAASTIVAAIRLGQVASGIVHWIGDHPWAGVGTLVTIGGIAFVVIATGGGALVLAPAAALAL